MTLEADNSAPQRFTKQRPCPICGGHADLPSGHGVRCYGWMDRTGAYARCTREEHAGGLEQNSDATFSHRLQGECRCGVTHMPRRDMETSPAPAQAPPTTRLKETPKGTVRYEIRDAVDGTVVAVHARRGTGPGKKVWWEGNLGGRSPADLLYRVETLAALNGDGDPVVLCEGEPAADAVAALGLPALGTVCGAASTISGGVARLLAGREVWLWPDNDDDGAAHMERNAKVLRDAGAEVKIVKWSDAPPKGDAADYLAAGGTRDGIVAMARERATGAGAGTGTGTEGGVAAFPEDERSPYIDWAAFWDKEREPEEWLIDRILARGRGHAFYAKHKVGKSLLMLWCALELVRAGIVVLYLDYEMGEADLEERLEAMGCGPETDLSLLRYALLPSLDPLDTADGGAALCAMVDAEIAAHPERHVAVVIDTVSRAVKGEENSNDTIRDFYRHTGLGLKQRGVTWARLDHAGKDAEKGQRGGSAKGDDVDVVWRLAPTEGGVELQRDAARMGWVPERVALRLEEEPALRYVSEFGGGAWPMGTLDAAQRMDELGLALDVSRRVAAAALREAGWTGRNEIITHANRYRRHRLEALIESAGTTLEVVPANRGPLGPGDRSPESGTTSQKPHENGRGPLGDHSGPLSSSYWSPVSPPLGGTGPGPVPDHDEEYPF